MYHGVAGLVELDGVTMDGSRQQWPEMEKRRERTEGRDPLRSSQEDFSPTSSAEADSVMPSCPGCQGPQSRSRHHPSPGFLSCSYLWNLDQLSFFIHQSTCPLKQRQMLAVPRRISYRLALTVSLFFLGLQPFAKFFSRNAFSQLRASESRSSMSPLLVCNIYLSGRA